jgi:hypothetical protein
MVQVDDLIQPRAQKIALAAVAPLSWSHRIPPANHRRTERITNPICKESAARTVFSGNSDQPRSAGSDSKSKTSELFTDDEISSLNWRASSEFESAIATFARSADGGLIVTSSALATIHRALLVQLVAQHKLPTVYSERFFAAAGGLISYGPNYLDQYRHAANYVDRILKGEKPSDLPVQMPTKFELIINLKTAKTLGLTVPATLLARADEVIE